MKTIEGIYKPPPGHWVGDGFPVRSLFDYQGLGRQLSPYLLLDHAGPAVFEPAHKPRGVGVHPHRDFETVSIVYEGEVAHRDSTGQGGVIGPGDVQWMTAGAGILHEEFHSEAFTRQGGRLHMVQLWVNLPTRHKLSPPGYQAILDAAIPRLPLAGEAGWARVIAGRFGAAQGPAHTFSPLQVVDVHIRAGHALRLDLQAGWNTALVMLAGDAVFQAQHAAHAGQLVHLSQAGDALDVLAHTDVHALLLSGLPLNEPIVGHGPFVMNTVQEIRQAITDFNNGQFGHMTP